MKLIRMGEAARMLRLTARQLVDRQRGDHILICDYRLRVYQERPGANRFLNAHDVRRALARIVRREFN